MRLASLTLIFVAAMQSDSLAGFPYNPANPRPNLFTGSFINSFDSYRRVYNRPRYLGGKITAIIEPTSQEAMSWHDNNRAGIYGTGKATCVNRYYYAKPWEKLQTGPRPRNSTPASTDLTASPSTAAADARSSANGEVQSIEEIILPPPTDEPYQPNQRPAPDAPADEYIETNNAAQRSSSIMIGPAPK